MYTILYIDNYYKQKFFWLLRLYLFYTKTFYELFLRYIEYDLKCLLFEEKNFKLLLTYGNIFIIVTSL